MSLKLVLDQPIQFTIVYEHGTMIHVSTTSPLIDHFLQRVKLSQSKHTWVNYAHDLKVFFAVVCQPLEKIDRQSCVAFMELCWLHESSAEKREGLISSVTSYFDASQARKTKS